MDRVEEKWLEIIFPENATGKDLLEFMKLSATFRINVNCKDVKIQNWIYNHKDWFKEGGE